MNINKGFIYLGTLSEDSSMFCSLVLCELKDGA